MKDRDTLLAKAYQLLIERDCEMSLGDLKKAMRSIQLTHTHLGDLIAEKKIHVARIHQRRGVSVIYYAPGRKPRVRPNPLLIPWTAAAARKWIDGRYQPGSAV